MRKTAAFLLLPFLFFSGCMGGDAEPEGVPTGDTKVVAGPATNSTTLPTIEPSRVPKYHPHDLWADRTSVLIFDSTISFGEDVRSETYIRNDAIVSGYAEFDPSDDGDDSDKIDKADVVYQGTKALVAKVEWTADAGQDVIPGLTFLYKPANAARFTPVENVPNGGEIYVPLDRGWADMPHQQKLSRWKFALEAYDPTLAASPMALHVARGEAHVTITAINGGQTSIDPPHPYNFLETDLLAAGEIERRIDAAVVSHEETGTQQLSGEPLTGWQVQPPAIIPWETTTVHAKLYYNYTGTASAAQHELTLLYTDAAGPTLKSPDAVEKGAGFAVYAIDVEANEADDPYATSSDWTWGVQPVLQSQSNAAEFTGDVHIVLVAEGSQEVY